MEKDPTLQREASECSSGIDRRAASKRTIRQRRPLQEQGPHGAICRAHGFASLYCNMFAKSRLSCFLLTNNGNLSNISVEYQQETTMHRFLSFFVRVVNIFRRARLEADLKDQLHSHRDMI